MTSEHPFPSPVRVRFAPSPTGTLHVGSARTALYNYLFARHLQGSFVLRIEDTDAARSTPEFERSILDDVAWLGLDWDEGPDRGGDFGPYRQSERSAAGLYLSYAGRLLDENKAYHCFCSQERLEKLKQECLARNEMPKYDHRCGAISSDEAESRLAAGEPATIRFRVSDGDIAVDDLIHGRTAFPAGVIGDFIIVRSDGAPSYNFAVVVDDIDMEITHVIRGEDHLTNTARQLLVYAALAKEPPAFAHHSLIMGPDGGKLSKRHGATSAGDFRQLGYLPAAIINYLALLSWSPPSQREQLSKAEMIKDFEIRRVARSPAIFDLQKLNWLNGLYIRDLDHEAFHRAIEPFLGAAREFASEGQLAVAEQAIQTSLVALAGAREQLAAFFDQRPLAEAKESVELVDAGSERVLELALLRIAALNSAAEFNAAGATEEIEAARLMLSELKRQCRQEKIPPKQMFRTLRIALTGRASGPELPFLLAGLAREAVRQRLEEAREFAAARLRGKV